MMALVILAVVVVLLCLILWRGLVTSPPSALEELGVKPVYPKVTVLPKHQIEAYSKCKDVMRSKYASGNDPNDQWMALLPARDKAELKHRLMQRAIGDMASLQKIDADARGYWKLFAKGIITRQFWNSVVDIEKELSQELEKVKLESQRIEPDMDPQLIISEAMHYILRMGDKVPSAAEIASSADAINELMRAAAPPGSPAAHGMPPGMPPMPGMPGAPPHELPPHMQVPQKGGGTDECSWTQNTDEVEVVVSVPKTATKAKIKVDIKKQELKCLHCAETLVEGKLGGVCVPDESTWTMEVGKGRLIVTLQKLKPAPWACLWAKDAKAA